MAHITADRVKETSITTGTGALTLAGAVTAFQAFSAVCVDGDTVHYCATLDSAAQWEVGLGTWGTGNILTRTTVLASSNAGAAVNFSAGAKTVFITLPASQIKPRRELLTDSRDYYFGLSGDDTTGDGSVGNPWATMQKVAEYVIRNLDLGGFTVYGVPTEDGAYTAPTLNAEIGAVMNGTLRFENRDFAIADISITGQFLAANLGLKSNIIINGFTLDANGSGRVLNIQNDNTVTLDTCNIAPASGWDLIFVYGPNARLEWFGDVIADGSDAASFVTMGGGATALIQLDSLTFNDPIAFSNATIVLSQGSQIDDFTTGTVTGTVTGKRVDAKHLSQIITPTGVEATDVPGDSAGTYASGAQLVAA